MKLSAALQSPHPIYRRNFKTFSSQLKNRTIGNNELCNAVQCKDKGCAVLFCYTAE